MLVHVGTKNVMLGKTVAKKKTVQKVA